MFRPCDCLESALFLYRMKQFLKYALLGLLAALIFYGGAGVNRVTYCCQGCLKAGIKAVAMHTCCSKHQQPQDDGRDSAFQWSQKRACGVERIEFEWNTTSENNLFTLEPISWILVGESVVNKLLSIPLADSFVGLHGFRPPPILQPRTLLSFLTLLLI